MQHILKNETNSTHPRTLVMLHGTGGDEYDMLPIAQMIDAEAPVISVKGNVSENGMTRFFRRLAIGQFDEEDLVERTHELNDFVVKTAKENELQSSEIVAIGYSNGANIAASSLFHSNEVFDAAILFHPIVPLSGIELPDLSGKKVFIGAGTGDPYAPKSEIDELQAMLEQAGAEVQVFWHEQGHSLTQEELQAAIQWYQTL
ncbi:alpha/beta hydrolase [Macrococcus hajekii]|uniref:Alpha/beta hydrolase n=1 Tax=Macrococcus hajekii TaxID=198482 RepID=A0A4R6BJZ1_9STAP|nr:alpha/beta hydrolase [Macrococcus hajekii]TDM01967.1 alpha/beta hydrolase [Macrococcus hajekii]GGB08920.1 phospholipase/carboxylesterase [Macrococcus hajekii]